MDDMQIVELFWQRSEEAIAETDKKYGGYCYQVAYNILGSREEAQEQVNDTYLAAWNHIPPQRPQSLRGYLGKITRNLSLDRYRAQGAQKRGSGQVALALGELESCFSAGDSPEAPLLAQDLARELERFLDGLPQGERCIFVGRYWFLWSLSEIGQRYGYTTGRVKSSLYRTRKKLQKYLEERGLLP